MVGFITKTRKGSHSNGILSGFRKIPKGIGQNLIPFFPEGWKPPASSVNQGWQATYLAPANSLIVKSVLPLEHCPNNRELRLTVTRYCSGYSILTTASTAG